VPSSTADGSFLKPSSREKQREKQRGDRKEATQKDKRIGDQNKR